MRPSDRAWIALATGVVVYDVLAPPQQTLSEGADRYMLHHPWITRGVAFALAGHVCNLLPDQYDVIHQMFRIVRWR